MVARLCFTHVGGHTSSTSLPPPHPDVATVEGVGTWRPVSVGHGATPPLEEAAPPRCGTKTTVSSESSTSIAALRNRAPAAAASLANAGWSACVVAQPPKPVIMAATEGSAAEEDDGDSDARGCSSDLGGMAAM
mmetsp:Transcript_42942/g.124160  ORF Transcript_42942/g.124160 Transcript_42942/m.124160 type:complete len:134 (+) Transcript_42942:547-948(+)